MELTPLIKDKSRLSNFLKDIPNDPGCYLMKDREDRLLYVGKSKKLRNRVRSYFRASDELSPRISLMVRQVVDIELIVTDTESEALTLESNLIKSNQPYFNVLLKDDKKYPYICITWGDKYPRILPKLLNSSTNEKTNFLEALDGKRISSGPSGAPTRGKLEVLPTGKNFFSVDIRAIPTETAWDLGKRSAEQIMELYLQENGEHLSHLAISIWGTSTMRNGGEDICQLFALMGLKPIWDGTLRRVVDVEVIPLSVLNRPRVDVTLRISGLFRDAFPQIIELIRRGQNLIGNLKESSTNNPLAESYRNGNTKSRIYGSAPGSYGAGLQEIINSGSWENQSELADAFIEWSKWRYEGSSKIIKDKDGLESNLSKVKVVLHSQDNREHDILDSDDYYQFQGGLISAIKKTSGTNPQAYFADNSRYQRPRIHKLSKEIDKVVRSRLLNPKWIEGIKEHGYKGAFEMSASLDYLFSYDATTNLVPNWCYQSIVNNWLMNNNTKNFISENNPWALRDIAERLLEASNRKLWTNATIEEISSIKKLLSDIDSKIENYTSNNNL